MKKNISRNPLWPDWYNGKKIDEVQFGRAFLEQWPLKCVNGTLYTLDGPVEDESEIKQRILENIEEYVTSGLSKKVTNILETIKLNLYASEIFLQNVGDLFGQAGGDIFLDVLQDALLDLALVLHRTVQRVQRTVDAFQRPLFQKGASKLDFVNFLAVVPVRP